MDETDWAGCWSRRFSGPGSVHVQPRRHHPFLIDKFNLLDLPQRADDDATTDISGLLAIINSHYRDIDRRGNCCNIEKSIFPYTLGFYLTVRWTFFPDIIVIFHSRKLINKTTGRTGSRRFYHQKCKCSQFGLKDSGLNRSRGACELSPNILPTHNEYPSVFV